MVNADHGSPRNASGHRWNHNIHYHDLVLRAVPTTATSALDVGTGNGLLARELRQRIPHVTGVDRDAQVLREAQASSSDITWVHGDIATAPLPRTEFDVVASIATVHHFGDLQAGLQHLAQLTAPGGHLIIIGCARNSRLRDYAADLLGVIQHQLLSRKRGYWQHTAPVQEDLHHTYAEVQQLTKSLLRGRRWRRLPLFRYALFWQRPIS
jgi:SAM-dependent methyltransferase